jgi:hypothetical protein
MFSVLSSIAISRQPSSRRLPDWEPIPFGIVQKGTPSADHCFDAGIFVALAVAFPPITPSRFFSAR